MNRIKVSECLNCGGVFTSWAGVYCSVDCHLAYYRWLLAGIREGDRNTGFLIRKRGALMKRIARLERKKNKLDKKNTSLGEI